MSNRIVEWLYAQAEFVLTVDDVLLPWGERLYLWIYDRTGATVGAVFAVFWIVEVIAQWLLSGMPSVVGPVRDVLIFSTIGLALSRLQRKNSLEWWNAKVEFLRAHETRKATFATLALATPALLMALGLRGRSADAPFILNNVAMLYVTMSRLRPRQPPRRRRRRPFLVPGAV